jgi:hypothetical protein
MIVCAWPENGDVRPHLSGRPAPAWTSSTAGSSASSSRTPTSPTATSPSAWGCLPPPAGGGSDGFIAGYVTLLDAEAVGLPVTAYLHVSLDDHHPQTVARFDALIRRLPEVLECHAMSGETDYLLKVVARSMSDYETFLSRHLLPEAAVRSVNTSFVLKRKKLTTVLPLE